MLVVLICIAGPPIAFALAAAGATLMFPFMPFIILNHYDLNFDSDVGLCRCILIFPIAFLFFSILYVIIIALEAVIYPLALASGCLVVVLFYLVDFFLVFLIMYVQCCKGRRVKKNKADLIEKKLKQ